MIIKGGAGGNVGFWSSHLLRDDTNVRADVMEISGLLSTNLPSALKEMEAIAAQSRCEGNFMYQANINPRGNERLTEAQWREAIDTLENHLGLSGHQRVVVEHEKEGRVHRHVVWNRVDVENLRVVDIGGNYYTHERVARTLELKFDLQRTASLHGEHHPEGRPERTEEFWQKRAAERSGIDPKDIKAELTDLWRKTDSGQAFAAAVEERGYILAQGDRRTFCIVDLAGDAHSLARRIEGTKVADLRERLADIDAAKLPTVDEARTAQRKKYLTKEAVQTAWESRAGTDRTARQEQAAPDERQGDATSAKTTPSTETWHDAATKMEEKIFHIQDAAERGGTSVGAGLFAEGITLARVDTAGKEDARLRAASLNEGELVAVTKWGDVHRLNPRYVDSAKLERAVNEGVSQTPPLSAALEYFATAAREQKAQPQQDSNGRASVREPVTEAKVTQHGRTEAAHDIKGAAWETAGNVRGAGLNVVDAAGAVSSLSSFAESLLSMAGGRSEPGNVDDRTRAQHRAAAALERIAESIERGETLRASDLANLTPTHLENIKRHGDDYIREMIADMERYRQRDEDISRTRER